ncbi:phage major capsid protein [Aliihoeflea aestuarii]|jgi:HK97 family phage major capsid protein|uniref:phage major capsid protein n=1 Tax=Aliihoeflea aestuarii TaxID=453840 RepID=UPI002092C403|nr:phage major capsid protein [Aliihoeflea aestuarii]MCO6389512.1 phage major capsid protein [Aliihoeflea aestuarii]
MNHSIETKAAGGEIADAFDEFMTIFGAFREANDGRLAQIEKRMSADVLSTDKVDRLSSALDQQKRALDELTLKKARPHLGGAGATAASLEHKHAFEAYVRGGEDRSLRTLEQKAMSYGSGQDGGYLVPDEIETAIGARLRELSPIRSIATVRQVSGAVLKKPFAVNGPAVGWVGETAARPQTDTAALQELQFPTMELYAMPAATAALLEDSVVDLDAWITAEVETAFAEQEGAAFVNGAGVNKPRGFLDYGSVAEADWQWGSLGHIATGIDGTLPADDASDVLIDTIYALKSGYRQNANWVMNRRTQAAIRKLKDADGNYLWQPPATAGARALLMGFSVVEAEDMPDIGSEATPIAFGDFGRGYLVVDRAGVRILRDPYSAKPYVLFYVTKRVGGGVQDFDAIKLVKFAAA